MYALIQISLKLERVICGIQRKDDITRETENLQTNMLCNGNLHNSSLRQIKASDLTHVPGESGVTIPLLPCLSVEDRMVMVHGIMESRIEHGLRARHLETL